MPNFVKVEANSKPINPPPIIARLSIFSWLSRSSVLVKIFEFCRPSSIPSILGIELSAPVLMIILSAESSSFSPFDSTKTVFSSKNEPKPSKTVTESLSANM